MSKTTSNGNGQIKDMSAVKGKSIEFPVTFELKAVMHGTQTDENNKSNLAVVFTKLEIKNAYLTKKVSSKGTYTSFTYRITLSSKKQMDQLYADLKHVEGLKFAL